MNSGCFGSIVICSIFFGCIYYWFYTNSENYRVKHSEIYEPCELMDPINLKIGKVVFSYPAKLDAYLYEVEGKPAYPRRAIKGTGLKYQLCKDDRPYHNASGISIPALNSQNWEKRWERTSWVPIGVFNGIAAGYQDDRRPGREETGYKEDFSNCHIREEVSYEGCRIYRYLNDLDVTLSARVATTDVNLYGKPVKVGEQQTREEWPEFMDKLEGFWRSMTVQNSEIDDSK